MVKDMTLVEAMLVFRHVCERKNLDLVNKVLDKKYVDGDAFTTLREYLTEMDQYAMNNFDRLSWSQRWHIVTTDMIANVVEFWSKSKL